MLNVPAHSFDIRIVSLVVAALAFSCSDSAERETDTTPLADLAELEQDPDVTAEADLADDTAEVVVPPPADPMQAGPLEYEELAFDLEVDAEGTLVPLDIALPKGEGPFPVVVFTHGFALSAKFYQTYKAHLASWGYVVILPSMPGTAVSPKTHDQLASYVMKILDWVEGDGNTAEGLLKGKADASRIGLSGHSMGGKISLLVASQDPRVDASFTVDPVDSTSPVGDPAGFPSVAPEKMASILVPLGLAGETLDGYPPEGSKLSCAPAEDNFEQYYLHAVSPAFKFDFPGANHMAFLDSADCGIFCAVCQPATADTVVVRQHATRYMTAFYNIYLKDQPEYLYWVTGPGIDADAKAQIVVPESKNL